MIISGALRSYTGILLLSKRCMHTYGVENSNRIQSHSEHDEDTSRSARSRMQMSGIRTYSYLKTRSLPDWIVITALQGTRCNMIWCSIISNCSYRYHAGLPFNLVTCTYVFPLTVRVAWVGGFNYPLILLLIVHISQGTRAFGQAHWISNRQFAYLQYPQIPSMLRFEDTMAIDSFN